MSPPRVLVLTADIGAGHDLPAALLADALRERGAEPVIEDGLKAMGPLLHAIGRRGAETILERLPLLFEAQYWLLSTLRPTRALAQAALHAVGRRGLLDLIGRVRPDAIVSTYPGTSEIVGALRATGRVGVPCASAITDLAALRFWAHPGLDLHLITHPESAPEVRAIAGRATRIRAVRGLVRPAFEAPPSQATARAALGLPATGPVAVVSGGGWAVGDLDGAVRAARAEGAAVVCLCGTNAARRARIAATFAGDPAVRVEGFTDRMAEWLAAADALVHATAGLTVLEAQLCGTWAISYGWGIAHIRVNNRAYRRSGLAGVAATQTELRAALARAFRVPRPRPDGYARLPAAADEVLALAGARPPADREDALTAPPSPAG